MKRQDYDHTQLTGTDVDIEISLKDYGFAWIETDTEYLIYYGIGITNNEYGETEYNCFDFATIDKSLDIYKEYNWIDQDDWDKIYAYAGIDKEQFDDTPLIYRIHELVCYYGFENIFSTSYWQGLTYAEVLNEQ